MTVVTLIFILLINPVLDFLQICQNAIGGGCEKAVVNRIEQSNQVKVPFFPMAPTISAQSNSSAYPYTLLFPEYSPEDADTVAKAFAGLLNYFDWTKV